MSVRRFFSDSIDAARGRAELGSEEAHHARDVLRLKTGDALTVFDGEGREFSGKLLSLTKNFGEVGDLQQIEPAAPESPLSITQASVVIPGDKYDLVVQKAVELGVARFFPLTSMRCEIKLKDIEKKLVRWRRIALDAAKQCGRARLMQIAEPHDVKTFVKEMAGECDRRIFFSEREGKKLALDPTPKTLISVIGPKGGWDDSELAAARDSEFEMVTFGGRILRAETASIALTAILQHRFGDIN